jgi:two-component system copper resistance phosphate regulon response regulator CusR
VSVPVLFLTCRNDVSDRVEGLEAGGDDYLGKPFAMAELVARVRSLARRTAAVQAPVLTLGDLVVDQARASVSRDGRAVTLTPKEYSLLEYLVRHAGQVVSRQDLLEHCWDEFAEPASNVVEARIGRLRSKLGSPPLVHTVRGTGYLAATEP